MPSSVIRVDGELLDPNGSPIGKYNDEDGRYFAVIVKCGHSGKGYYIPIMMTAKCKDMESAIEYVKTIPRVQRNKKDVVIDAFEITADERHFIEAINNHDAYLKNYCTKADKEIEERKVRETQRNAVSSKGDTYSDHNPVKTADSYGTRWVIQRAYAPTLQGDRYVRPNRVNKDELLHEYFKQATLGLGFGKGDGFFPALYYLVYGKENDLGLEYVNSGYLTFKNDGKRYTLEIPEISFKTLKPKLDEVAKRETQKKEEFDIDLVSQDELPKRPSQTDKFNKRFQKFMEAKKEEPIGSQPGEE